jgi:hypothetical protein
MNDFIKEITKRMKPDQPTSPSDLEVIKALLSDKFIEFHMALIKQGATIMTRLDELLAVVAKETEESAALVASNKFLTALNAELQAKADTAIDALDALETAVEEGVLLSAAEWAAAKAAVANIVPSAPVEETPVDNEALSAE